MAIPNFPPVNRHTQHIFFQTVSIYTPAALPFNPQIDR